uniref:Uncharacterized protein n=1 Tax=Oryza brachyantha TaxID=4533 RepID=J3LWC3_ORYBR
MAEDVVAAGVFFMPTGIPGVTQLGAVASLAARVVVRARPMSQRRNIDVRGSLDGFSNATNLCFRELYVMLFHTELLVSYIVSTSCA